MLKAILGLGISLFLVLCILLVPFTFNLFPYQQLITEFVFNKLLNNAPISSDSKGLYMLVLLLFVAAHFIAIILTLAKVNIARLQKIKTTCYTICIYYFAIIFIKYGFDKVFKSQFYQPEPNTLYTNLGNLDKDILYWSTIGSSYLYNIITGSIEIIAAILLLIKRTRAFGIALLFIVLSQIVLINFAFDISVKLFSMLLLCMAIYVAVPYLRIWFGVMIGNEVNRVDEVNKVDKVISKLILKLMVIGLLFLEGLYPYIKSKNFNDDNASRPYLHGAYAVTQVINNSDTLLAQSYPFKRFFIHRNGYIIFEDNYENMQDFKLQTNTITQQLQLTDYNGKHTTIKYNAGDSLITLNYTLNNKFCSIQARPLNLKKMPLLQDGFNWTVN
ncbi:MAG: hypothetical protein KA319_13580 [Ferruginibacter sp.]|nr:hypothetical protein [Ferruginibacter sp.]